MKKIKIIYMLIYIMLYNSMYAQNNLRSLVKGENGVTEHFTFLRPEQQVRYDAAAIASDLGLDKNSQLVLINQESDQIGEVHYRYYQTYKGYKVENTMYIIHTKDGMITGMNGSIVMDFDSGMAAQPVPAVKPEQAIQFAIASVHAQKYMWENNAMEQALKDQFHDQNATYYPGAVLVWYHTDAIIEAQNLHLAYKVDVYAETPVSRDNIYVDAQTGSILGKSSIINYTDATGTANTAYSGTQTIHSDFSGGSYRLRDYTKGNGIITLASGGSDYTSASANWSLSAPNQYALDAHWGVGATYQFYLNNFNRNSVNNGGLALTSYVNESSTSANNNAYWDGSSMHYGNLTSNGLGTTAIDITGHELTHGVTQYTCALVYKKEPGAINESLSDIMGKSVQFWTKPADINWAISNDLGWNIRDMSNPNSHSQPDTYNGTYYIATAGCTPTGGAGGNDYCGVHTNSGVGNYFFYLLVSGGSGTNDLGHSYSVSGIGLSEADQILYRSQTVYLTSTSQYADWRIACVHAARDIYGSCSAEAWQTANAWYAVGVGPAPAPDTWTACGSFGASGTPTYTATNTIINCSGGVNIVAGVPVSFTASEITLSPGFTATNGCDFLAYVTPCSSSIAKHGGENNSGSIDMLDITNTTHESADMISSTIHLSPNPFNHNFNLDINLIEEAHVSVTIYDMMGKVVDRVMQNQTKQKGLVQLQYSNEKLQPGIYFCGIEINGQRYTEKVVKL